jgi:protoporphyrinogen oxidase
MGRGDSSKIMKKNIIKDNKSNKSTHPMGCESREIGILGGGLTGLVLVYHLGSKAEVLEKESECGGLCRSLKEDGFTFDWGGAHIIFSRDQAPVDFMRRVLDSNCRQGRRENKIFYKGTFVKYPFENGLSDLPPEDRFECLYHYLTKGNGKPKDFKEWIYRTFGKGIAEKYLIPYNEKIWKTKAEDLSLEWASGRVPEPPLEDVIKSAVGIPTEGYTHQLNFYYPKRGGIGALIMNLEKRIPNITRGFEVREISKENGSWLVSNNKESKKFDLIVSTIPLFDLLGALPKVPEKAKYALNNLRYNSLITVMLGIDGKNLPDYTAIYFPDNRVLFHRLGLPKVFSPNNVPSGKSSIVAEITALERSNTWKLSDTKIIKQVIGDLDSLGIINKKKICFAKVKRTKYAYVIYDKNYYKNIKVVKDFIRKQGIVLCGRFSEFEYLNMDECVKRATNLAQKIKNL